MFEIGDYVIYGDSGLCQVEQIGVPDFDTFGSGKAYYFLRSQEDGSRNVIAVKDGAVFMQEANCRDGLCIRQGKMRNGAKTIVCLPHKIVVQLTGDAPQSDNSDLDIIIQ